MKVYIIGDYGVGQYSRMFTNRGWELINNIFNADLIQFTDGEDITPEIYGEANTASHNNFTRDLHEAGVFAIAKRMGKPMAGICRGAQFLNVMCGGSMIQHVEGHAISGTHRIIELSSNRQIQVTSTHHQMMVPSKPSKLIAFGDIVNDCDPEVIYYEHNKVLCFQPHPEYSQYKECQDYYFELLDRCLGIKV